MANTAPASDKQLYWIAKLVDEKVISDELRHDIVRGLKRNDITKADASKWLDILFDKNTPSVPVAGAVTEPGFYLFEGQVYRVKVTKTTGNLYAQRATAYGFAYEKGLMKSLRASMKMTGQEIADYGQAHGFCVNCSALLTDPASMAIGLGTVCGPKILGKEAYKAAYKAATLAPAN